MVFSYTLRYTLLFGFFRSLSFDPRAPRKRYTCFRFYVTILALLASVLLMIGIYGYFVGFTVRGKVAMRYDLFSQTEPFSDGEDKTGEELTKTMTNSLNGALALSIIVGIVILLAYFSTFLLLNCRIWIKVSFFSFNSLFHIFYSFLLFYPESNDNGCLSKHCFWLRDGRVRSLSHCLLFVFGPRIPDSFLFCTFSLSHSSYPQTSLARKYLRQIKVMTQTRQTTTGRT